MFIKKVFHFFGPFIARLASKFEKSTNMIKKNCFFKSKKVSKNAEFHADFKSVKKTFKKCTKKVISKNMTKICTFSTFTHVHQTCFAYNFFFGAFWWI
jgi:hypothetical protein